jgi:hypothetical protein
MRRISDFGFCYPVELSPTGKMKIKPELIRLVRQLDRSRHFLTILYSSSINRTFLASRAAFWMSDSKSMTRAGSGLAKSRASRTVWTKKSHDRSKRG